MRVRISYGIEIDDIPEKAERLGLDALYKLQQTLDTLSKAVNNIEECNKDYSLVLEMLEKVRLELSNSDLVMGDLQAILEGLHNYHNGVKNVSERRPTMDPSGDTTTETEDSGEG
jgi:hypothetical protein